MLSKIQIIMKKVPREQRAFIRKEAQRAYALSKSEEIKGNQPSGKAQEMLEQEKERLGQRVLSGKAFWEIFRDEGEQGINDMTAMTGRLLGIFEDRAWEDIYFFYCLLRLEMAGRKGMTARGHLSLHNGGKSND